MITEVIRKKTDIIKRAPATILSSFAKLLAFGTGPAFSQDVLPFPTPPMGGKVLVEVLEGRRTSSLMAKQIAETATDGGIGTAHARHPSALAAILKNPQSQN